MKHIAPHELDFAALLRPGERVLVGQATAEPLRLTERLAAARNLPEGCSGFLGPVYSDTFAGAVQNDLRLEAYGAIGNGPALAAAGRLDVLPSHYSAFARAFADGSMRADVILVQLSPGKNGGPFNLSLSSDHVALAARHARLVIAEINPDAPHCHGGDWPSGIPIHMCVDAERAPLELAPATLSDTDLAIGGYVASIIPDRAVLQLGVGTIPQAVLAKLAQHRDLGIHSGAISDGVVDLVERGVITNAAKEIDPGVSVAGLLIGTQRLYRFVDRNAAFRLSPPSHTHAHAVIGGLSRFCAVNSALQVDLTGQVNAETVDGRYLGAVGGQVDFVRGANASPGGRAIIALPATARGGSVSRIVACLSTVTCPRSDVDAIVTEFGVAELRGATVSQRVERMIAIAAPQFREDLVRACRDERQAAHV